MKPMTKSIILALLLVGACSAQTKDASQRTSMVAGAVTSRTFFGASAPGSVTGNLAGDWFIDTTGHNAYYCGAASGTSAPACTTVTAGGWILAGPGSSAQHYPYRVGCQGGNAAMNFANPASNGQAANTNYIPICDSAGGSVDGYAPITTAGTTVLWMGPIYLDSSFADPITVHLQWMTTATTGTFIPTLGAQCVSTGGLVAAAGFATSGTSFSAFASSTANGTASHVTFATALSLTTGCSAGQILYLQFAWPASGGGTVASANVKVIDVQLN